MREDYCSKAQTPQRVKRYTQKRRKGKADQFKIILIYREAIKTIDKRKPP